MEKELRNTYINTIIQSINLVLDGNFEFLKIRTDKFPDIDLESLTGLADDDLVLLNQYVNYEIITRSKSIIIPFVEDQNGTAVLVNFEIHEIKDVLTFEKYCEGIEFEYLDFVDYYDTFNEALIQQKNMINMQTL